MGDFEPSFVHALAVQSWSLYGIGMFFICLRIYARVKRLSFKGLQADDYLMLVVGVLYTTLIVCLNVICQGGGSNLYPPEQFVTFSPEDIKDRIQGSKIVIVSEQAMLNVIYTIKCCMLIMYSRLTLGLQVRRMINYMAAYVAIGWVATEIAFFTACRPFRGYWAMPPPNPQCTTLEHYAYVQGCFNISSDLLMLGIPLPLITRLNVPLKQKSVLFLIFSMGAFVIIAAILTKIFNLTDVWDPSYMLWYTREASVAVYVSNLPLIWPLLREWFPSLKVLAPRSKVPSQPTKYDPSVSGHFPLPEDYERKALTTPQDNSVTTTIKCQRSPGINDVVSELDSTSKQEMMDYPSPTPPYHELPVSELDGENHHIHMTTTVQISEEHVLNEAKISPKQPAHGASRGNEGEPNVPLGYNWMGKSF